MTASSWVSLGLGACLFLAASQTRAEEWSKHWQVSGKPELHVGADDASVAIEVGSGSEITAVVRTRGMSIGGSGVRVIEHQSGDRVDLEVREPRQSFNFGIRSVSVELRVPRDLAADVRTGDGSVKLSGLHGALRIGTGDGSIQGDDLDGTLDAHTGDGSLHLSGRFDALRVKTDDGSVDVQARAGSAVRSDWRVETGDGSVHLGLPSNLAADLQLRTGDGSIHLEMPLSVSEMRDEHDVRGKLNGGGSLLDVHTGDGSITVSGT